MSQMGKEALNQSKTFYRALADTIDVQRWKERQFNSTHEQAPLDWNRIFESTHSLNPEDYPLIERPNGPQIFTDEARRAFVDCINKFGYGSIWPREARIRVGEMNGTCAYCKPEAALVYAREKGDPSFVVFSAVLIDTRIPERGDGGVLVHCIEPIDGPMCRATFADKYVQTSPTDGLS